MQKREAVVGDVLERSADGEFQTFTYGEVFDLLNVGRRSSGCQVQARINGDEEIGCVSNGCDGRCELMSEDRGGGRIRYWCECK